MHGPGREVPKGSRQPKPGLGRPVDHDLVGQIDEPRAREATENAPLHDADEGPLVPEISRDGNDTGRSHRPSALAWRSVARRARLTFRAGAASVGAGDGLQPLLLDRLPADRAGRVAALLEPPQSRSHQAQLLLRRLGDRPEDIVGFPLSHLLGEIRAQGIGLVPQVRAGSARSHLQLLPALEQACAYRLYVHWSLRPMQEQSYCVI